MFEIYNAAPQTTIASAPIVFSTLKFGDRRIENSGDTSFKITAPGRYLVSFNAIGSTTAEQQVGAQLYENGVAVPSAQAIMTSAAAADNNNLSFTTIINIPKSCACVDNSKVYQIISVNAATFSYANLVIYKLR